MVCYILQLIPSKLKFGFSLPERKQLQTQMTILRNRFSLNHLMPLVHVFVRNQQNLACVHHFSLCRCRRKVAHQNWRTVRG